MPSLCPFTSAVDPASEGSTLNGVATSVMRCWMRRCTSHCGMPASSQIRAHDEPRTEDEHADRHQEGRHHRTSVMPSNMSEGR